MASHTPPNVAAMVRLLSTQPAHHRRASLVRPLVFLVLLAALATAPFAVPFLAPGVVP